MVVASDFAPGTDVARVEITTRDANGATIATRDVVVATSASEGVVTLPFSFGASPSGDAARPLWIEARAFRAGEDAPLVTRRAIAPFVDGERRRLVLFLGRACEDVICEDLSSTCDAGACVDAQVPLSALDPVIPGMELTLDGGPVGLDGGPPIDAGVACGPDPDCDEAVRVEVGDGFACALRYSGRLACWGESASLGQLGNGATTASRTPVAVRGLEGMGELIAGAAFACASSETGAWCWGANDRGQLAQGADGPGSLAEPTLVEGGRSAFRMHGSAETACAPGAGELGEPQCWGRALAGVVGAFTDTCGDAACARTPTDQTALAGLAWLADEGHTCLVRNETLSCAGANAFGEVGDGTREARAAVVPVIALPWVWAAATTPRSSCAVSAVAVDETVTSSVSCWGADDLGQLGAPGVASARCSADAGGRDVPCALEPLEVEGVVEPIEISGTRETMCAREQSGRILCWGSDADGGLGDGAGSPMRCDGIDAADTGCARSPVAVIGVTDAIDLDARAGTFCAVRRAGSVACWGRGWGDAPTEVGPLPE